MWNTNFTSYPRGCGTEKLEVTDTGFIRIGDECIDVRPLHNISTSAQVDALAFMLRYLTCQSGEKDELEILAAAMRGLENNLKHHRYR
jgi:hypothetical protein